MPDTRREAMYEVWRFDARGLNPALVKSMLTLEEARRLTRADPYTLFVHYRGNNPTVQKEEGHG